MVIGYWLNRYSTKLSRSSGKVIIKMVRSSMILTRFNALKPSSNKKVTVSFEKYT